MLLTGNISYYQVPTNGGFLSLKKHDAQYAGKLHEILEGLSEKPILVIPPTSYILHMLC
jgi:hypothetical protein